MCQATKVPDLLGKTHKVTNLKKMQIQEDQEKARNVGQCAKGFKNKPGV